jgi:hypothetical protein
MCDYSLQGLESQVLEITTRLTAEVNETAAEVELEVEIIALQHFETLSAHVGVKAQQLLQPTAAVLAEYEALLASLLPDVSEHLKLASASGDLAAAAAASAVANSRSSGTRRAVGVADLSRAAGATSDRSRSPPAVGASPTTAALVVLGALFAGVALAGGAGPAYKADGARRRSEYEALL